MDNNCIIVGTHDFNPNAHYYQYHILWTYHVIYLQHHIMLLLSCIDLMDMIENKHWKYWMVRKDEEIETIEIQIFLWYGMETLNLVTSSKCKWSVYKYI